MTSVTLVDYGLGNLFSVRRAFEVCGADVRVTERPEDLLGADRLVLPGVGAFSTGMDGLRSRGLVEPIARYAARGNPLLGICLGMQMLFTSSAEFGEHPGLGLIDGRIAPIAPRNEGGGLLKVPHIGWSRLDVPAAIAGWDGSVLERVTPGTSMYFVHSYTAVPSREEHRLADTIYGGVRIAAAVRAGHISGCQFHPEKSASAGLEVIKRFLEM
jgi:glutamine amidotransferase